MVIVLLAAILGAFGQLNFKLGSDNFSMKIKELLKNRYLLIGVVLYGISTVMFIVSLKGGELSVLYPLVATSYIWTTLLAKKVLKEEINAYKLAGVAMIVLGVIFII
jgi:drug/metabolite transporter (DMT)-like permease